MARTELQVTIENDPPKRVDAVANHRASSAGEDQIHTNHDEVTMNEEEFKTFYEGYLRLTCGQNYFYLLNKNPNLDINHGVLREDTSPVS